jgi:ribosomal protein S18 acetylase RimI-like enzyme
MPGAHVREAVEADLDALVEFEIEISKISFPDDPMIDPKRHRKRLEKALGQPGEGTFVAVDEGEADVPRGWTWVSLRTNFLTGEQYGNLRSLAIADDAPKGTSELLLERAIAFARAAGVTAVVGKVHVQNVAMRAAYRRQGFRVEHLSMSRRWPA